ncbi:agmatinase family protein [Pseudochryseolinea flava]|uniref:Agmatinase n=1 Tax=Pseudochryseolinea flava TaxID=2059302 RepID=A0A364XZ37_9BACT|nr:agmatinase family protein [Pseudochryseolinea flava]RAV99622.1 agmatinase [Pseudochryseolinea flava]
MTRREEIIRRFDPNGPGIQGNLFGLPFDVDTASVVLIPVPWEVTVTYHTGTADGPEAILKASQQIDSYMREIPEAWKLGTCMLPASKDIKAESRKLRAQASQHISKLERGEKTLVNDPLVNKINESCESLNIYVKSTAQKLLRAGKMVGIVGGDHSTPLGLLRALADHHQSFGILQIDAHADLRKAYEDFTYSHASIMYNVLKIPAVSKLVQVGIRDYCDEEAKMIEQSEGRVVTFFDDDLKDRRFSGQSWQQLCDKIVRQLPKQVYISFDIDGLDPKLCPNTGTPVPGGLEFQEAVYLIKKVVQSGRKIIGFDLCEVTSGDHDWDANVGARMLFQLCHWMGVS